MLNLRPFYTQRLSFTFGNNKKNMSRASIVFSHVLAWLPLLAMLVTFGYLRWFVSGDFGLASVVVNEYVCPIIIGSLASGICLIISFFRLDPLPRTKWFVQFGFWYQGCLVLLAVAIFLIVSRYS